MGLSLTMKGRNDFVLRDLFRWWAQQMRSLLPMRRLPLAGDALLVRAQGEGLVEVVVRRRGSRQIVGKGTLDDRGLPQLGGLLARVGRDQRVVLELPGSMLLEQEASLPLAAESELSLVLTHEMDRLTPFSPGDVFWSWTVAGRDVANGRLLVRLSLVLKAAVAPLLQGLARAGVTPAMLELSGSDGAVRRVGLVPPGSAASRHPLAVRVAAWACVGLAIMAVIVPVVQQQWALATVNAQISALQPRVSLVEGLRRRLAASSTGAETFAAESERSGSALRALAAVTRALPDDSYLTEFTLRDRKLTLTGRSDGAVRLIGLLSSQPGLANPAFAAPVFRSIGDHGDQFTISADLAP